MASMSLAGVLAYFLGNDMGCDYFFWLLTSLGHDSGSASDSVPDGGMVGISGLGAWFDSGYMVYVSSWVLLNRLPCSPCTWKLDAPL